MNLSSQAAGSVAERAETLKQTKYAELVASGDYIFAPIAIETLGAWDPSALSICADIGGLSQLKLATFVHFLSLGNGLE